MPNVIVISKDALQKELAVWRPYNLVTITLEQQMNVVN